MIRRDQLSEDEVRAYLRPHTPWFSIVGPLLAIGSVVGGGIWWAAKAPDPAEFKRVQDNVAEIRTGQALTQQRVDGLRDDVSGIKVKLDQLLMQRRK